MAHTDRKIQFRGRRNTDSNTNGYANADSHSDANTNGDGDAYPYMYMYTYGNSKGYTNTKAAPHSGSAALARAVIVQRREFVNR